MNTGKAVIAGLVVTIGLLAANFGLEAVAQLAGPEEIEEEHTIDLHEDDETEDGETPTEDLDFDEDDSDADADE